MKEYGQHSEFFDSFIFMDFCSDLGMLIWVRILFQLPMEMHLAHTFVTFDEKI